jgi:Fe-S-cluster containining protein
MPFPRFPLDDRLAGSSVREALEALHAVYADVETVTSRFSLQSGVSCPSSCGGICCRNFEPDVMEAEALYLAAWLIESGSEGVARLPGAEGGIADAPPDAPPGRCPFWDEEGGGVCLVYPARGLICRLFGFSAVRGARGEKSFGLCFAMDRGEEDLPRQWREGKGDFFEIADPPVMADYGSRVAAISPGGGREGIGYATARAFNKLSMVLSFRGPAGRAPDGEGPARGAA